MELSIDFETRSTVDLRTAGVYRYAEDHRTDVWCMAWQLDDMADPEVWVPGQPLPRALLLHIAAGGTIRAWNAQFERIIWREIMVTRYNAPEVRNEQWVCSAAEAAAMALPRGLDDAARVLGVEQQKDVEGKNLMLRMARPRARDDAAGVLTWWDVPDRVARLHAYCAQDVRTERSIVPRLRRLTPRERELYLLDQRMNDRGLRIDRPLIVAAQEIAAEGVRRADREIIDLTNGLVRGVTKTGDLRVWLAEKGVPADSVAKAAVATLLEGELPAEARRALTLRSDAGRSSIAKLGSMLDVACHDDRLRGLMLYHGASTGRWSGRLVQPHNFPRGEVPDVEELIPYVHAGDYDALALFAPPVVAIVAMLRAMLVAAPGCDLIAGDFSAIECRVLNWLAGQEDVLASFRAYDAGDKSQDPYKRMAVKMGRAARVEDVTKQDRQAGKAAELGCGFQMGWRKFIGAAWSVYQVRVDEREAQTAVDGYRASHGAVKQYWTDIEQACIRAVQAPGVVEPIGPLGRVRATCRGGFLYIVLPSGRPLCYAAPRVEEGETPWGTPALRLSFMGVNAFTRQWGRQDTYGGHLTENIVQAVARDLMAESMLRLESVGYAPILSVHDEVVAEVPQLTGSVADFERVMRETPAWAAGCPVAVEAWRGPRYRK